MLSLMKSLLVAGLLSATLAVAQSPAKKEIPMSHQVSGSFEVKAGALEPYNKDDKAVGRYSLDKQFHGALEGTSRGEMLAFGTGAPGTSGGYVAIEKFTGKIEGRSGSFVLQHSATMTKGKPDSNIFVVPDSGTGDLAGINGKMQIKVEGGKHSYVFDYTPPQESAASER
jgi:Protein of unknown function (DUF3224)